MSKRVWEIGELAGLLTEDAAKSGSNEAYLVGVSGIDASGKGWVADRLTELMTEKGVRVARLTADAWLNLPEVRFSDSDPGGNFYRNGLRLKEMFDETILPLKRVRKVDVRIDALEETALEYEQQRIVFNDVDLVLLEGILLFRKEFRGHFDRKVWIECPFETAIKRAIARSQEGLGREETIAAYERIYFPAQRIHFDKDDPVSAADIVFENG